MLIDAMLNKRGLKARTLFWLRSVSKSRNSSWSKKLWPQLGSQMPNFLVTAKILEWVQSTKKAAYQEKFRILRPQASVWARKFETLWRRGLFRAHKMIETLKVPLALWLTPQVQIVSMSRTRMSKSTLENLDSLELERAWKLSLSYDRVVKFSQWAYRATGFGR